MYPGSRLRTCMVRGLLLIFLVAFLMSCDLVNPFNPNRAPASTRTQSPGYVPITASNVSRLVRVWSSTIRDTGQFSTAPTVAGKGVYIGLEDGVIGSNIAMLYALDAVSGTKLWSYSSGGFPYTPIVNNGVVYVSSVHTTRDLGIGSGTLDALNATSGTKMWSYNMGLDLSIDASAASLSVANGVVYIDSLTFGKLSALDAKSGAKLWNSFTGGPLISPPTATGTMVYISSGKTLYAFALPSKTLTSPPTTPSSTSATTVQSLTPSTNKAPIFTDVPGLHIQSTNGLLCPGVHSSSGSFPNAGDDLVFTTGRLTYSKDEIQQIRKYLHQIAYSSSLPATDTLIPPPPTLQWILGSRECSLSLEISNTGSAPVQITSLGVQLMNTPRPNGSQQLHTLDGCSVAGQQDANYFCPGPSGGGGCASYRLDIALKAAPATSIFAAPPDYSESGLPCLEPILHPNDTVVFEMVLSSHGIYPDTVAPYLYSVVPVLTVIGANGSRTFTLSALAGIAAFVDQRQVTCYGLPQKQATTFVPVSSSPFCLAG
jgi:hypothetical protein